MRVLVMRPQADAEGTAVRLAALGHDAVLAPVTRLAFTGTPPPDGPFAGLVLTSAHAAPFCRSVAADRPVFAVGTRTAAAARAAGLACVHEGEGDAADLAALIRRTLAPGSPLLHPAGRDRKAEPARSLRASGYEVAVWECYAAQAVPALPDPVLADLDAGRIRVALHYSRRSAALARDRTAEAGLSDAFARLIHLCLSADVAGALKGLAVRIAAQPRETVLLALIDNLVEVRRPPP
jgi:uroporphyrinogen-III synthase